MDEYVQKHQTRLLPLRQIYARPRLFICIALGILCFFVMPEAWRLVTRLLLSWNLATAVFLVSILSMMSKASHHTIRRNAALHDEGQYVILGLAVLAALASTGAIVVQFGLVKDSIGALKVMHIALAFGTIVTAWTFVHIMFALHYAHEFFDERQQDVNQAPELRGGMAFPGLEDHPDYLDFVYFSFTIGVACATSDVNVTSSPMRRLVLIHSVLSFFFNLAILGLTINIAAGLI